MAVKRRVAALEYAGAPPPRPPPQIKTSAGGGHGGCDVRATPLCQYKKGKKPVTQETTTPFPILPPARRRGPSEQKVIVPIFVGREKSVRALEEVMQDDRQILAQTRRSTPPIDDPTQDGIYRTGVLANVLSC